MIFGTETTIGNSATQDDLLFRFSDREDAQIIHQYQQTKLVHFVYQMVLE